MRFRVELIDEVYVYLRHFCTKEEVRDFTEKLQVIREDPISGSELHLDRKLSPYTLRRFAFGAGGLKIAVFELDVAEPRIRVVECRLFKRSRTRGNGS